MQGKKAQTKAERKRNDFLKHYGCFICRELGFDSLAELHHIVKTYRLGHGFTIPLCQWHHRGIPLPQLGAAGTRDLLGPSLASEKKAFVARFGTELEILKRVDAVIK